MEFEYDYSKYDTYQIDPTLLDRLINMVLDSGTGYIASIIAGVKLICIGVFLWIKWVILQKDLAIEKQKYQLKQSKKVKDQIDQDDLD